MCINFIWTCYVHTYGYIFCKHCCVSELQYITKELHLKSVMICIVGPKFYPNWNFAKFSSPPTFSLGDESLWNVAEHDDVIKWKHFSRYWPFVQGIHRWHKGLWRGALMFSSSCAPINGWVNTGEDGDLRRHCAHYDVIVMEHAIKTVVRYGTRWLKYAIGKRIFLRDFGLR